MFGPSKSAAQLLARAGLPAGVAALTALVYLNALAAPFVYDDHYLIVENQSIRKLADLRAIVLLLPTRPLVNLSYAIDHAIWGLNPFGYHLTNVALHIVNVVLLFYLALRLMEDREGRQPSQQGVPMRADVAALGAAVLLGVHPVMTSAVTYVAGRAEVLCATFFLSSVLCARQWLLHEGRRWWAMAGVFWMAALATKEIAVMLPIVLICYERSVIRHTSAQRRHSLLLLMVPFALVAAIARVATFMLVEHPGEVSVQSRLLVVQLDVILRYLTLIVAPEGQTIFHAVPAVSFANPRAFVALGALGVLATVAWGARKAAGLVTFGILWFMLLLLPSTALALLGADPMAEHRVYLAGCGLFLAGGTATAWILRRAAAAHPVRRLGMRILLGVAVLSLSGRTVLRNAVWSDPVGLWREATIKAPDHWLPHVLLAEALQADRRIDEAISEYRVGIGLRADPLAYQKLTVCLLEKGRVDEAVATLEQLKRLDPRSAIASNGLGGIAMMNGQLDRARGFFLATLTNDPQNVPARQSLALIAEKEPVDAAAALRLCEEIQGIAPRTPGNDECIDRNRARLRAAPAIGR